MDPSIFGFNEISSSWLPSTSCLLTLTCHYSMAIEPFRAFLIAWASSDSLRLLSPRTLGTIRSPFQILAFVLTSRFRMSGAQWDWLLSHLFMKNRFSRDIAISHCDSREGGNWTRIGRFSVYCNWPTLLPLYKKFAFQWYLTYFARFTFHHSNLKSCSTSSHSLHKPLMTAL